MKLHRTTEFEIVRDRPGPQTSLDLVVPFTTPALTLAALNGANRLAAGLDASIRLIKIQIVPYPLELTRSPVPLDFIREQLRRLPSAIPVRCDVRLVRDFEAGLESALTCHSLIVLATRKRPWRTRAESLGRALRRKGFTVITVDAGNSLDRQGQRIDA